MDIYVLFCDAYQRLNTGIALLTSRLQHKTGHVKRYDYPFTNTIVLFGNTRDGEIVCCVWPRIRAKLTCHIADAYQHYTAQDWKQAIKTYTAEHGITGVYVHDTEIKTGIPAYGVEDARAYLEIEIAGDDKSLGRFRTFIDQHFGDKLEPCEKKFTTLYRFMHEHGIAIGTWMHVAPRSGQCTEGQYALQRLSRADYEFAEPDILPFSSHGGAAPPPPPPIVFASWDIETFDPDPNNLPRPENPDMRTWMISTRTGLLSNESVQETCLHILVPPETQKNPEFTTQTVLDATPDAITDVRFFTDEIDMFEDWRDLIIEKRVQGFVGHNTGLYDWPCLFDRVRDKRPNSRFFDLGFLPGIPADFRIQQMNSSQRGDNNVGKFSSPGQFDLDTYPQAQRNYKLSSYSLDSVASHVLGKQKNDVTPLEIHLAYKTGDPKRILEVAKYAAVDTELPALLTIREGYVAALIDMASLTGVSVMRLQGGTSFPVYIMLARCARDHDYYLSPNPPTQIINYEGGFVAEPKKGMFGSDAEFQRFVLYEDFKSLYPSIIDEFNLSHDTLIKECLNPKAGVKEMLECFVKEAVRRGLLPTFLNGLAELRSKYKKKKAEAEEKLKDPSLTEEQRIFWKSEYKRYDIMQNNVKVQHNSGYGFCGIPHEMGQYSCKQVAVTVTAIGRETIQKTGEFGCRERRLTLIDAKYGNVNVHVVPEERMEETEAEAARAGEEGIVVGITLIYGDTDSVMLGCTVRKLNGQNRLMERHISSLGDQLGHLLGDEINKFHQEEWGYGHDRKLILEFEQWVKEMTCVEKKKYAGCVHKPCDPSNPEDAKNISPPKLMIKGLPVVRRDNFPAMTTMLQNICTERIMNSDADAAMNVLTTTLANISNNALELEDYIRTVKLSRKTEETNIAYRVAQQDRRQGLLTPMGSRVAYVVGMPGVARAAGTRAKLKRCDQVVSAKRKGLSVDDINRTEYVSIMRNNTVKLMHMLGYNQAVVQKLFSDTISSLQAQEYATQSNKSMRSFIEQMAKRVRSTKKSIK